MHTLKITLIISLLLNSAGPGYALRPMAAVHSVKMSSAGILKDEVLNILPEADQQRIDASVRFIEHVIRIAALSDLDLQRLRDRNEFFAFDNIPAEKVLSFIEGLKKKNAVLNKIDTSWEEDFILFLGKHHALFQDIKLTPQFSCRVHYEARARRIPGCETLKGIYEGIDMLVNSLLFDKTSETDERFFRTAKALEMLGIKNNTLGWSQGGLDRIALYAERKDNSESTLTARKFLSYFVGNLFDSAAMSYAFMFNRSIMEGFLEPDYAKENNVGVVYLFSGSQHLYNQARQIAEEKGLDTSRLHKFYMNRKISEKDPEILRDYIEQEGLSRYKTLIIVDTGFHGSSACRFYDIISILPKHPEHIEARLLALNIKHRPFTYGKMKVCGWNNLIWSLNPELAATTTNSIFFLAHILDNSLPGKFRSPARLYRDSPEGDIKPFLIPAELPVLASIVEEAMEKGTKKLLSEGIDYWKTDEEIWDLWLPDGAAENIRKSNTKSSSAGRITVDERRLYSDKNIFEAEKEDILQKMEASGLERYFLIVNKEIKNEKKEPVYKHEIYEIRKEGEDFDIRAVVWRDASAVLGRLPEPEDSPDYIEQISDLQSIPIIRPDMPIILSEGRLEKGWGAEILHTMIEARYVADVTDAAGEKKSKLPDVLKLFPGSFGVDPKENLALLKILSPGKRPKLDDLYLEVHWQKYELYVVTDIDKEAWPDGKGKVACGLNPQLVEEYRDKYQEKWQEQYKKDFRTASDEYRREIYEKYTAKEIKPSDEKESDVRDAVYRFIGYREVEVGDVLIFPKGTVHSLRHGIEVAEILSFHYERGIIVPTLKPVTSFDGEWPTDEAFSAMEMSVYELPEFNILEQITGKYRVEDLATFPIGNKFFTTQRVSIEKDAAIQENTVSEKGEKSYHMLMPIKGSLEISAQGRWKRILKAKKALIIPENTGNYSVKSLDGEEAVYLKIFIKASSAGRVIPDKVMIRCDTTYYKLTKRAEGLKAALEQIGFKNVDFCIGSEAESTESGICVIIEDEKNPYRYDIEHKADKEKRIHGPKHRVFEWANQGKRLAEVIEPAKFEELAPEEANGVPKKLEPRQESCITGGVTPSVAAEFIARKAVESLKDAEGPLLPGNEAMVTLPEYNGRRADKAAQQEEAENGLAVDKRKQTIKMAGLLNLEKIHIIEEGKYKEAVTKECAIKFRESPRWGYLDEKRPVLVFENFMTVSSEKGKIVLGEDDEIEIEFDKIRGKKWEAAVVRVEEDGIICSIPDGFSEGEHLALAESGTITKKYNAAQTETKLQFIASVLESIKLDEDEVFESVEDRYPLVNKALKLKALGGPSPQKLVDMVVLSETGEKIANDDEQLELIAAGLNGTAVELGWGPAGSGKTFDASEIAYHDHCLGKSVIIGAQTNRAADNALIELKRKGVKVYRIGNHRDSIDPLLWEDWLYPRPKKPKEPQEPSTQESNSRHIYQQSDKAYFEALDQWRKDLEVWRKMRNKVFKEIRSGKAVAGGTCMTIGLERKKLLGDIIFDKCIVEEAGIASFTELLMAFAVAREAGLAIGDHKQLGIQPIEEEVVRGMLAAGADLKKIKTLSISLFESLLKEGIFNVTMLKNCYRMTPLLVELANYNYDNELNEVREVSREVNHNSLIVIDTKNLKDRREDDSRSPSLFNTLEVRIMEKILRGLGEIGIDTKNLGALTPYAEQIKDIKGVQRNVIEEVFGLSRDAETMQAKAARRERLSRNTGTIYIAQGREFPVVMVSAVRSNEDFTTGFMKRRMWHTMDTRAQDCLIVIFDSENFLKTWDNEDAVGFIKHMLMLAQREKDGGIYIELTPENPWPDLTETFGVLAKHLPETYGEAEMPLFPDRPVRIGAAGKIKADQALNRQIASAA